MCNKHIVKILLILLIATTLNILFTPSILGQNKEILLKVDEYDKVKSKSIILYTAKGRGFGVKFTNPSSYFKVTSILVFGTYNYWGSYYRDKAADNTFTVEVRDSKLKLLESYQFRYGDFFNGYDSLFSFGGIPRDAPKWASLPVDVIINSKYFYVIVYPNAEFMPYINSTYYGLFVGTDMYRIGDKMVFPSKSSSYRFEEGLEVKALKFNYLIRVEGLILPLYSIRISTKNLPSEFTLSVRNETSSFQLKGGEIFTVKALGGSSFSADELVYDDKVRYRCVNPTQIVEKAGDIVFEFYPEYQVSISTKPEDVLKYGKIKVDGSSYGRTYTDWFKEDTLIKIEAPRLVEGDRVKYIFTGFNTGLKDNTIEFKVKEPIDIFAEYKIQYYIEVSSKYSSASGSGWYDEGSKAEIRISEVYVSIDEDSRYAFSSWEPLGLSDPVCEISVDAPAKIEAKWVIQYRVTATSPYGDISISDEWVTEGDEVEIELSRTYVSTGFLVGKSLSHWVDQYGNTYRGNPLKITVDKPLKLEAVWKDNYIRLYLFLIAVVVGVVIVIVVIIIMWRLKKPPPPPPPPNYYSESRGGTG